ncbi:MAG TPA: hypothetical protein VL357_05890 [Rariglobus sp.]|jgi:hypothetical protein|nr:hypothetical protein [Rariglobus sp.]
MDDALTHPIGPAEAQVLVLHIAAHQRALGLSDVAFVKRYPDLSSARTWRTRLIPGTWEEVRLNRWVPALRRVMAAIAAEPTPPAPVDPSAKFNRHLAEAERAAAEGDFDVATAHLAAAKRGLSRLEKELSDPIPF